MLQGQYSCYEASKSAYLVELIGCQSNPHVWHFESRSLGSFQNFTFTSSGIEPVHGCRSLIIVRLLDRDTSDTDARCNQPPTEMYGTVERLGELDRGGEESVASKILEARSRAFRARDLPSNMLLPMCHFEVQRSTPQTQDLHKLSTWACMRATMERSCEA